MSLTEAEFRTQSDSALEKLNKALGIVAETYDAEVMYQNGVLTVEIEEPSPGKMVISPNAPVRQIWVRVCISRELNNVANAFRVQLEAY